MEKKQLIGFSTKYTAANKGKLSRETNINFDIHENFKYFDNFKTVMFKVLFLFYYSRLSIANRQNFKEIVQSMRDSFEPAFVSEFLSTYAKVVEKNFAEIVADINSKLVEEGVENVKELLRLINVIDTVDFKRISIGFSLSDRIYIQKGY